TCVYLVEVDLHPIGRKDVLFAIKFTGKAGIDRCADGKNSIMARTLDSAGRLAVVNADIAEYSLRWSQQQVARDFVLHPWVNGVDDRGSRLTEEVGLNCRVTRQERRRQLE